MNHDDARRAISARMDGEPVAGRAGAALDRHLETCASCRAFEAGAWRLREVARFGVAEPVPDLVAPIMASVRAEVGPNRRAVLSFTRRLRRSHASRGMRASTIGALAAAVVVGLFAGSLTFGGPWRPGDRTTIASAADVSAAVAAAAARIDAYQATFAISESDPAGPAPRRSLTMDVAFHAPEQFRLDVNDDTPGAGLRFAADDVELIVNGGSSYQAAPSACPIGVCPPREQVVRNRLPFSSATPAPTDLILPVSTLVDARAMRVVRTGRVLGRDAIEVRLPFERARPLFPFLELGGRWRPFFPGDRVALWLDARNWFPLRYTVYPAAGPNRDAWELRFGVPDEPAGVPIFQVTATSIQETAPPAAAFAIPHHGSATDEGAHAATIAMIRRAVRFRPVAPGEVDGLPLYRSVLPESRDDAVLTYSRGLSWLKLGETQAVSGGGFFGPIGAHAAQVNVAGVGTAYYEPATTQHGRRLAIHTADGSDLYLETNLSRQQLLGAAAALDVRASPLPSAWLTTSSALGRTRRGTLAQAAAAVPFTVLVPARPPAGSTLASVETVTLDGATSVNLYFQREDGGFEGGPLRLHEEAASRMPVGSAPREYAVSVGGARGRWTPDRHQLEWIRDGVYFSLDGSALQLDQLIAVATSLAPATLASEQPPSSSSATAIPVSGQP